MPDHKPFLPPQIGKWLASKDPTLVANANAAIAAAEPYANDLLLEQLPKERNNHFLLGLCAFFSWQFIYMFVSKIWKSTVHLPFPHGSLLDTLSTFFPHLITLPLYIALMLWCIRRFALPAGARYAAVLLKLAERGDVRAVPLLLSSWLEPSPIASDRISDVENALIALTENAAPGSLPLSESPKAKDHAAVLRARFAKMTRREKGAVFFTKTATLTGRRVQLWLALLPHLAADTNPKSLAVLSNLLEARAQTLDEELLQNTTRTLTGQNAASANEPPIVTQAAAWKITETADAPALLQRRR